jgi:hypothetical protein
MSVSLAFLFSLFADVEAPGRAQEPQAPLGVHLHVHLELRTGPEKIPEAWPSIRAGRVIRCGPPAAGGAAPGRAWPSRAAHCRRTCAR